MTSEIRSYNLNIDDSFNRAKGMSDCNIPELYSIASVLKCKWVAYPESPMTSTLETVEIDGILISSNEGDSVTQFMNEHLKENDFAGGKFTVYWFSKPMRTNPSYKDICIFYKEIHPPIEREWVRYYSRTGKPVDPRTWDEEEHQEGYRIRRESLLESLPKNNIAKLFSILEKRGVFSPLILNGLYESCYTDENIYDIDQRSYSRYETHHSECDIFAGIALIRNQSSESIKGPPMIRIGFNIDYNDIYMRWGRHSVALTSLLNKRDS